MMLYVDRYTHEIDTAIIYSFALGGDIFDLQSSLCVSLRSHVRTPYHPHPVMTHHTRITHHPLITDHLSLITYPCTGTKPKTLL